jgi:drug/metabolite transporter (DMT)-like permease
VGILFAFIALVAWALGDFFIQKSARKFGDVISLFFVALIGTILIFPFVSREVLAVLHHGVTFWVMFFVSAIMLGASLLQVEALRRGKLSVVEPVFAFELPITVLLAGLIIQEVPNLTQCILLGVLFIGILLVSIKSIRTHVKFEHGVFLAIAATGVMAFINILFGVTARITNPLLVNWFASAWITLALFCYLWFKHGLRQVVYDAEHYKKMLFTVGALNNLAWVAFVYSMIHIPIAVATGITESYIALSAFLGLTINKETLELHQKIGLGLAIIGAILLAVVTI